ncbi:cytochrome P450 2C38 [Bombina bombina]|uniref:cytochrome P450 2C38 n=1 Tax=Bombina bombina TaxID=8345 RepID=UPI00235AE0BA|nr:cytochrome P450 2C38 [Bombina bombina]
MILRIMDLFSLLVNSVFFLLFVLFVSSMWLKKKRYSSLPPGPSPWPLLGTPQYVIKGSATRHYPELCKKYGSVFTVWKLTEPVVVLCGYETVKDALVTHSEQFSARPHNPVIHMFSKGYSFGTENGQLWRHLRRFMLTSLRNFGMGKKSMEDRVLNEAQYLLAVISETKGVPFMLRQHIACTITNIISTILYGKRYDYRDKELLDLTETIRKHLSNFQSKFHQLCNIFPFLLYIPAIRNHVFHSSLYLQSFLKKEIKLHKQTLNTNTCRDFMDYFLLKIKEEGPDSGSYLCDTGLLMITMGLLAAGTDTISNSLTYSVVCMAHFPDVQAKVQKEIDEVTGSLRPAGMMDKAQMPYTNAVIHETQRFLNLVTEGIGHAVTMDTQFHGFTIPKGTTIISFFSSVLNDPTQWETPDEFNPGHFLDDKGQFQTRPAFMAFSAGKRVCLGENLARMELFLLFCSLLQRFTFSFAPGNKPHSVKSLRENKFMFISSSQLCAIPRNSSSN